MPSTRYRTEPVPSGSSPAPALELARAREPDAAGFGVYVHWPFCASKCPYCDFNSHVRAGGIDEPRFVRAFLAELRHWAELAPDREVSSVFFGGGTPSLMSPDSVDAILEAISASWRVRADCEVTLEANPSSVEAARFQGYRAAGVNRVSLGVQSLDDAALRALGRLHSVREARAAIEVARTTFGRYSFDMIYARPGQTLHAWREELGRALTLVGGHLSLYQLTIEPETPFAALHRRGKLRLPQAQAARDLYALAQDLTGAAGLPAYEISNHAVPGQECRHNLTYWRYGEWAGIGPGAHSRVIAAGMRQATSTERQPELWLERVASHGHGITETAPLGPAEQADEALLMGLRLSEGLDLERLAAVSGMRPAAHVVDELVALGLLEHCDGSRLRASAAGRMVLNEVVLRLACTVTGN
ncbi:MAG: coproporphyrinogen III oxidase [Hyphomicrobiaceae bacterium]|nr:coproporphyrinogen III oxidase [Hyphomicrobiaceae bacterium]